jgi:hypothetical protein
MKTLKPLLWAALAAGAVQTASALNYSSTHLLLVFRQDGVKDVMFDIGSVSNYMGLAAGTVVPVSYNHNAVLTNFPGGYNGVRFAVAGTTSQLEPYPRVWLTDGTVYTAPADMTFSKFSQVNGKIDSVGQNAVIYTASNAAPYIVSTSASSSWDYLVTYGSFSAVSTLNGDAPTPVGQVTPLPVDAVNPTTVAFYETHVSTSNPKPPGTFLGGFTLDSTGALYFTAGTLPVLPASNITDIEADPINSQLATISFTTVTGVNYGLYYATDIDGPWAPVPGAGFVSGDGTVQSRLSDYNAVDPIRYYRVKTIY